MFCAALPFLIPFLKSPEWGFFILPVFRKTEEIIAGGWFDLRQKVLKTSIKSIHRQQAKK